MPVVLVVGLWCVLTYLICGIPVGMLVVSARSGQDIRTMGSGNIGTTNVGRMVGKSAAALTLAGDICKGFVCTFLAPMVFTATLGLSAAELAQSGGFGWMCSLVYLAAIAGHVFSPYLHFHGGKGIAVGFGAALGFVPAVALGLLVVFIMFVVPTRIVSVGSIAAAASLSLLDVVLYSATLFSALPFVGISLIVIWAHRSNIKKLVHGQEKQFCFHHDDDSHTKECSLCLET